MRAVTLSFIACSVLFAANRVSSNDDSNYIKCLDGTKASLTDCLRHGMPKLTNSTIVEPFNIATVSKMGNSDYRIILNCSSVIINGFSALNISRISTISYGKTFEITFEVTIPKISSIINCHIQMKIQGSDDMSSDEHLAVTQDTVKASVVIKLHHYIKNRRQPWKFESLKINPNNLFANVIMTEPTTPGMAFDMSKFNPMIDTTNEALEPVLRNHFKNILRNALDQLLMKFNKS